MWAMIGDFLDACVVCLTFAAIIMTIAGHDDAPALVIGGIIAVAAWWVWPTIEAVMGANDE